MANDTAKTVTTNLITVQGTFEPLPPYEIISFIGPGGTPFYAPADPNIDGATITNSTINSTTIGQTTPAAAAFTTASATTMPSGQYDLTNKLYVDAAIAGISWKQPVRTATTVNVTLSGEQTIDTVALVAGDRVLVKDQSSAAANGIYVVAIGTWSRSDDANTWDEMVSAMVFVESGGQSGSAWYCPIQPGGTLGTTAVTWSNFSVAGNYYAGTGLSLAANTFSITNTGVSAATYGSASTVPTIAVNAQGQITSASNTNIALSASAITSGTLDSARLSGSYGGITGVGTLTDLTVSNTITGSISGNAATATTATSATTATNLAGGANGSLPYQSGSGTTTFLSAGTNGQVLTLASGVPSWANPAATGDVTGPASSTDNAIARFDSTTGKIIQNSAITLSDAGALQNITELNFDVTPTGVVGGAGSVSWNDADNCQSLEMVMAGGNVLQQIGEDQYYRVKASSAITKGQVVMFTGTLGASGGLTAAPATGLTAATGSYILGIAAEDITLNSWGYVSSFGEVRGFDTTGSASSETWANGDVLYYNPAVTGGLTKNVPAAPNAKVQVCAVVYADANGTVFVRPTFEPRLNDLSNVYAPTPSDNDLIVWDNTDGRWENRAPSTVTAGLATSLAGGATGSLPYQSASNTTTFLAAGTDGQVLKLASGVPTWSSDASGVTIVDDTTTNATRYLTFTSATTGNITTENVASTKLVFNPSTGSVGIGTSSPNAGCLLEASSNIDETSQYTGQIALNAVTQSTGNLARIMFFHGGHGSASIASDYESSGYGNIIFSTRGGGNPTERMRIASGGNVGIGTNNPTNTLHVYGGSNTQFKVESSGAEANMTLKGTSYAQINNSTGDLYITNDTANNIILRTNTTERLRVGGSGQIGLSGANYGTSGQVLTSQGSGSAPVWASPSGGKVLQVVSATKTDTSVSTSTSLADVSGLSVNITPSSSSNKILVFASIQGSARSGWNNMGIVLVRGSTQLCIGDAAGSRSRDSVFMPGMANDSVIQSASINYLDSPATTSSTTYKIQFRVDQDNPGQGVYINRSWNDTDSAGMARVASTITVMEIAA